MAGLVCIAFIRAVNNASDISLNEILLKIQTFKFNFDGIKEIINFFTEKGYLENVTPWQENVSSVGEFFKNIFNVILNGIKIITNTLIAFTKGIYTIIKEAIQLIAKLFNLITYICGFTT